MWKYLVRKHRKKNLVHQVSTLPFMLRTLPKHTNIGLQISSDLISAKKKVILPSVYPQCDTIDIIDTPHFFFIYPRPICKPLCFITLKCHWYPLPVVICRLQDCTCNVIFTMLFSHMHSPTVVVTYLRKHLCCKSLMAKWLEQVSQWYEMCCHDLEVMSSNPGRVELEVRSTYVLSRTWSKNTSFANSIFHAFMHTIILI